MSDVNAIITAVDKGMDIIDGYEREVEDLRAHVVFDIHSVIVAVEREKSFTIQEAEPIGPKAYLDVLVIAPCTGNTLAKLCNGITDSPVLMAAKAHIRNNKPLIISISTNDAMGMNFKNIGMLMNMKNIYFVPFYQDDPVKKPNSLIGKLSMIPETIEEALKGKQLQPVLCDK